MKKTLWILECSNGLGNELVPFYATSREDAEQQVVERVNRARAFPRVLVPRKLTPFPCGFTMHHGWLPGVV